VWLILVLINHFAQESLAARPSLLRQTSESLNDHNNSTNINNFDASATSVELQQLKKQVAELQQQNQDLKLQMSNLPIQVNSTNLNEASSPPPSSVEIESKYLEEIDSLKTELEKVRNDSETQLKQHLQRENELLDEQSKQRDIIEMVQSESKSVSICLESLRLEMAAINSLRQSEQRDHAQQLTSAYQDSARKQIQIQHLQEEIATAAASRPQITVDELKQLHSDFDAHEVTIVQLKSELEQAQAEIVETRAAFEQLQQAALQVEAQRDELMVTLECKDARIVELEEQVVCLVFFVSCYC
jgi:chromosome segregation ATPase